MRLHALRGLGGKLGRQERPCLLPAAIRLTHFSMALANPQG